MVEPRVLPLKMGCCPTALGRSSCANGMVKWEGCDWKFIAVQVQQTDTAESIRPYLEAMRVTALDVLNLGRQIVMQ